MSSSPGHQDEVSDTCHSKAEAALLQDLQLLGGQDFDLDCFSDEITAPGESYSGYAYDLML